MFFLVTCQGKNIVVFYGSQTGTAEEFANRLAKDAHRYVMKGMAADPEEYDMVIHKTSSAPNKLKWICGNQRIRFVLFLLFLKIENSFFYVFLQGELSRLNEIENSLAIFCMATYGEGDPTDNAQDFYDWLQEGDADLSGVKYTVSSSLQ